MNLTIDQQIALNAVASWEEHFQRKVERGSRHIVELSAAQANAADLILEDLFKKFEVDPEEWYKERNERLKKLSK